MKLRSVGELLLLGFWCLGAAGLCARDAQAAGVSINSPSNGATVSGQINVVVSASGVAWVDLDIDSHFHAASPPLTFSWETTDVGNGSHTITAYGFSASGSRIASTSIKVTVDNSISGGRAYYVAAGGSDSNSGTSTSSPWRTLNKVNSANLQPGDTVYFHAGEMWRGTLRPPRGGIAGAPITFASYGSGNRPVISGADVVSGWHWYSGSIYRATQKAPVGNVFVNGGPGWGLRRVGSVGAMTAGTWHWDSSAKLLYVRLSDGSSPANHTIEAATRVYGYFTNSGTCADDGHIRINGLTFQRTAGFGIYFHCFGGSSPLAGVVIENSAVTQTGTGHIDGGQYYAGIMFLQEPAYSNAAPQILNNITSYTGGHGNGINVQGANNALVRSNNVSYWNHNGIDIKTANGVMVQGNTSRYGVPNGAGYYTEHSSVTFERNIAYSAHDGIQVSAGASAKVYNNSLYECPTGIYFGPDASTIVAKNNAIGSTQTSFGTDGHGNITEDYDDLGAGGEASVAGQRFTISQWRSRGHTHDMAESPMWVSPPRNMDLSQDSPCINAGTSVGLPYNGYAPDMGAIEYP